MQLPQGVNGYRELVKMARHDPDASKVLKALRRAMREEKVFTKFTEIGDLVFRFSYAARDGLVMDTTGWEPGIADLAHKLGDIYERWLKILEE